MLMPKRVKRRRVFRGRMNGKAMRGNFLAYGEFGLVATEPSWVTSQQIEAARVDQDFPRQARDREAGRDPHGFR